MPGQGGGLVADLGDGGGLVGQAAQRGPSVKIVLLGPPAASHGAASFLQAAWHTVTIVDDW